MQQVLNSSGGLGGTSTSAWISNYLGGGIVSSAALVIYLLPSGMVSNCLHVSMAHTITVFIVHYYASPFFSFSSDIGSRQSLPLVSLRQNRLSMD